MPENTLVERQESEVERMFGGAIPLGAGMGDKSMLQWELDGSNKFIRSEEQTQLNVSLRLLHHALVAYDNWLNPYYEETTDNQTGRKSSKRLFIDRFTPITMVRESTTTDQLAIEMNAREQHLRMNTASSLVTPDGKPPSSLDQIGSKIANGK